MADQAVAALPEVKKKKHRSPAYPSINLAQAVKRAEEFYKHAIKNSLSFNAAASLWEYKPTSSGALLTVATLKSFGLLNELESGSGRTFQISPLGLKIVADKRPDSVERQAAIKEAALRPKIHADLWRKYNGTLPPDVELQYRLENDLAFNVNSIPVFIREFRDTISYAKLGQSDSISSDEPDSEGDGETPAIKVDDYVQWTSQGMDQFTEPRRVREIQDSTKGPIALFEGCNTGAPVAELAIQEPPASIPVPVAPKPLIVHTVPANIVKPTTGERTMRQEVFSLAEGPAILNWPSPLSKNSIAYLETWLNLVKLKIKEEEPPNPQNYMEEKIASGECMDIAKIGEKVRPGVFRLQGFKEKDGMDYCDLSGKDWIRSIGKHKETGELLASTGTEFYGNADYECVFLR
jgi:hypothetical protein